MQTFIFTLKLLIVGFFSFILGIVLTDTNLYKETFIYPKVSENVFVVTGVGNNTGTAFEVSYNNNSYLITAAHVCRNGGAGFMYVGIGKDKISKNILALSDESDVCILESLKNNGLELSSLPSQYTQLFSIGYPFDRGELKQLFTGHLLNESRTDTLMFKLQSPEDSTRCFNSGFTIVPDKETGSCYKTGRGIYTTIRTAQGASGLPVCDNRGNVVGLISKVSNGMGIAVISDVQDIKRLLRTLQGVKK